MSISRDALRALIRPESVAVVGADPQHPLRSAFLTNLVAFGYRGSAFGISRKSIVGECVPYFHSMDDLPAVPELVIAAVGAQSVPEVLATSVRLGARAMIVCDGGFADAGAEGTVIQAALSTVALEAGIALLGPNCYGIANFVDRCPSYIIPLEPDYEPGTFAAIAASGSILDAMAANGRGVRWSHLIGTGNEAVLDSADFIDFLATEDSCSGVALFLETVRKPSEFRVACLKALDRGKPIVLLKAGRSEQSRASALAHSGALSPPDRLLDVWLRSCGITVVEGFEEMLAAIVLFQTRRTPRNSNVSFVSPSGGLIELLQDVIDRTALTVPDFTEATKESLISVVGPLVRRHNPLDWWSGARLDDLPQILEVVASDSEIGTVVMLAQFGSSPMMGPGFSGHGVSHVFEMARRTDKLLVVLDPLDVPSAAVAEGISSGAAVLGGFDSSIRALDSVLQYYAGVTHGPLRDVPVVSLDALHGELGFSGKIALDLVSCVVAVIDTKLATSLEETHAKSKELQFPIVLKSGDANSLHKTEKQLVRLNLRSPQQVEDAANELFGMGCASLLLQPQIEGVEVLIGVHRDEQLGHFLLVGLGGIWTEILDDVSIRPLGIGRSDALRMLENLRSFALLQGARGRPVVNLDSVVDAICGIDALARAVAPLIDSIDINPVIATNEGAWAVDAVLIRRPVQGGEHDNLSVCPILA